MDHCYARPWNWRPESTFLRPTKTLFMPKQPPSKRKSTNPLAPVQDYEEVIDVVATSNEPSPIYDKTKAKNLMEECERHAALARVDDGGDDWVESVQRCVLKFVKIVEKTFFLTELRGRPLKIGYLMECLVF